LEAFLELQSQIADVSLDPAGTLWVANYEDTVTRIDSMSD
jgi:hypothetical protein